MSKNPKKWGGEYVFFEAFGAVLRYAFHWIINDKQSFKHLCGEDDYPEVDTRQRAACLFIGIVGAVGLLAAVGFLIAYFS